MAELITEPILREMFDIHKDVKSGRLTRHIGAASRRMRTMIGDEAYADALLDSPTNAERKEDFIQAEASLAMHFAVFGLNTVVRPSGLVKTEKVEGDLVLQYMTPKDMADLSQLYLEMAEEILRPYALADGTPHALDVNFAISGAMPGSWVAM